MINIGYKEKEFQVEIAFFPQKLPKLLQLIPLAATTNFTYCPVRTPG